MLRLHCPNRDAKTDTNLLSTILVSLLPILILVGLIYLLFSRQLKAAGRGALQFGKSRARLTSPTSERVTFEDVSGIDEAKEEVQEVIDYLRDPERFQKLGGRIPKGVLMIGPPGTGKTLLARAIAGEADVPFFAISGSDFVEMFVGVGASRVRDMFEEGKRHSPCLIFIDEIDAVGRSRFSGIGGGHDEREQTLNALLVEMDGFESNSSTIVIAATNRPDVLDPALLRPGRFDRQITVDLPDLKGRFGILSLHAKRIKVADGVDLGVIARGTPGFSGADLANLINEAALLAARLNKAGVELADLEEARDKVRWGKERRSRKVDERDRRVTAFHEAGHALVGMLCKHATPLHKITIVPRGVAYLGATMHLPEQDRYTQSRREFLDELAVLMGGRVAEELVCDDITSGAAMDIRQATDLAKKMVCQWGMSERMGTMSYSGGREEPIFLGRDITRSEDFSEDTAREIDQEIRRIIDEAKARVHDLLTSHIDDLRLLGETLLEQETMDAAEVRELLGLEPLPDPPGIDGESVSEPVEAEVSEAEDSAEAPEEGTVSEPDSDGDVADPGQKETP
ncbi:MAG: ATP-dependent zinc metalloprotease FtsH [Lentisphaerae bacterium]|nr:ATP-dependent zinc metalloprotease FtsH [Lentisphaerota bacterium]MBT5604397.1 ATP-dependent zinc metalloprotease FtsH [Lentisphaerota bacterium]MBT7059771.1 ATP-dependent zinc metalloprotease FtsH [Lentisphaerota bacterium]MBT7843913.1 ATP-dependent zinc metalloprotease FtsH [Lentisphaerota bacterium]